MPASIRSLKALALVALSLLSVQAFASAESCNQALAPLGKAGLLAYCGKMLEPANYTDVAPTPELELCVLRGSSKADPSQTLISTAILYTDEQNQKRAVNFTSVYDPRDAREYAYNSAGHFTVMKNLNGTLYSARYSYTYGNAIYEEITGSGNDYRVHRSVLVKCYSVM
ncbi:MAG: hypothetical protein NDJ90_03630 [Oligoflexia bacterium]|nr:hypothetical protein [Oligoflexia bacterium]